MKILVTIKRVEDYESKIKVKPDNSWIVTEGVNYRSTFQKWGILQPAGDRVVVLEDTNGDGAADKETVFYQDPSINAALGICVLGNKVIVSSSPNVFVLTDTNGDGKADKRELLFTGIKGRDHDHGVHAFVFGPDGKLYFNFGNEGKELHYPVNREVPLHGVIDEVEKLAPAGFTHVDRVLSHSEREAIVKGYAGKAGFTQAQVNK